MTAVGLVVSDVDGTLVPFDEDRSCTGRFAEAWRGLDVGSRPLLCYSSGRLLGDLLDFIEECRLPQPDYCLAGVGTELYDVGARRPIGAYQRQFDDEWDLAAIEDRVRRLSGVERQPQRHQSPYKSSWFLRDADDEQLMALEGDLATVGIRATVIYSSDLHLDVLPAGVDKGNGLTFLARLCDLEPRHVVVAGDTGNDSRMFLVPEVRGVVVANARQELHLAVADLPPERCFLAGRPVADGVLEGLRHFGVLEEDQR